MCTPILTAALVTTAKIGKQPKCLTTNEWIKKMCSINIMEYYSALKKEWNLDICSNMGGPRGYYVKWNKLNRERQILYDFTYMWNLKQMK